MQYQNGTTLTERKKDGRGGPRPGSGRPRKIDELALIERMDKISAPVEALKKLWELASAGDVTALRIWLEYRYGKPKQTVDTIVGLDLGSVFPDDIDV